MEVAIKIATTADAKIATLSGQSKWISCEKSRKYVQNIRSQYDCILTGIGTVLADNPKLNIRIENYKNPMPKRIILDSRLRTPAEFDILDNTIGGETIIFTSHPFDLEKAEKLASKNAKVIVVNRSKNGLGLNLIEISTILHSMGLKSILIEAGPHIITSFLEAKIAKKLYWFRSNHVFGSDGIDAIGSMGLEKIDNAIKLERINYQFFDNDILEEFKIEY